LKKKFTHTQIKSTLTTLRCLSHNRQ